MNRFIRRMAVPLSAAAVLGTAGFAYMASNTVSPSNAGQGHANVTGYTVTDVHYPTAGLLAMSASKPGDSQNGITQVAFKVTPDNAGFAAVDIFDHSGNLIGGGGASNCSQDQTSRVWTCNVTGNATDYTGTHSVVPVTDIASVDIEAVQSN